MLLLQTNIKHKYIYIYAYYSNFAQGFKLSGDGPRVWMHVHIYIHIYVTILYKPQGNKVVASGYNKQIKSEERVVYTINKCRIKIKES